MVEPVVLPNRLYATVAGTRGVERAALLAASSLVEAVERTVRLAHDRQAHVSTGTPNSEGRMLGYNITGLADVEDPYGPRPPGHLALATLVLTSADAREWVRAAAKTGARPLPSRGVEIRESLLNEILLSAKIVEVDVDGLLSAGLSLDAAGIFPPRLTQLAAMVWWETRMIEGHTPEAAQTLLALRADPEVLAHVEWQVDGSLAPRMKPHVRAGYGVSFGVGR